MESITEGWVGLLAFISLVAVVLSLASLAYHWLANPLDDNIDKKAYKKR